MEKKFIPEEDFMDFEEERPLLPIARRVDSHCIGLFIKPYPDNNVIIKNKKYVKRENFKR